MSLESWRQPNCWSPPRLFNLFLGGQAERCGLHFQKHWTRQNLTESDNQVLNKEVPGRSSLEKAQTPAINRKKDGIKFLVNPGPAKVSVRAPIALCGAASSATACTSSEGEKSLGNPGKGAILLNSLNVKISQGWKAQSLPFPNPGMQLAGYFFVSVLLRVSKHLTFHPSHCCRAVHSNNSNAACWKRGGISNSTSKPSCAVCSIVIPTQQRKMQTFCPDSSLIQSSFTVPYMDVTLFTLLHMTISEMGLQHRGMKWFTWGHMVGKPRIRSQWLIAKPIFSLNSTNSL